MRMKYNRNEVVEFIRNYQRENGYAPSIREIQEGCGILSSSTVSYIIGSLESEGRVKRVPGVARGLIVTEQ